MANPDLIPKSQDAHLAFLERNAARLSAIAEAGKEIGSFLELSDILEYLIDKALQATGGETGSVMLLDEQAGELSVRAHRGIHPYHAVDVKRRVGEGISGWVARTGEPLHLERAICDERFNGVYTEDEIVDALCVPLKYQDHLVGVLNVNHHCGKRHFSEEDMHALIALGGYAAVAIQNAHIYGELAEKRRIQEQLIRKVFTAQEDERKRVAADIHDGPAQAMAALQYKVDTIERLLIISSERARVELLKLQDGLRKATQSLRRVLVELRPTLLDDLGLMPALRQHLERYRMHTGINAFLDAPGKLPHLDPMIETVIYRIVQEALNNVEKHSGASDVRVAIRLKNETVKVSVRDNGRGFNQAMWENGEGPECLGLEGMRERARMIGGVLTVESAREEGTEVLLEAPVTRLSEPDRTTAGLVQGEEDLDGSCERARS